MQSNLLQKKRLRPISARGQTLVEYALILAFISVVAIGVLMSMGGQVSSVFTTVSRQLTQAQGGGDGTVARAH